jgi:hypothetical protein
MKRLSIVTLALLMLAAVASAHDGGGQGAPPLPPGMDLGMGGDFGHGGGLIVGSDGTVYISKTTGTSGAFTTTVTAVRTTGTTAWTATLPSGARGLLLSGNNLITSSETVATDGSVTTTLTAISTASGSTAWTKTISGRAEPAGTFNGGTYVVVVVPATTSGGTATRSLVALGNDGSTLWTISL